MSLIPDDAESAEHFTRRFESFTDIVFGFSLSFLASRLVIPAHEQDIFRDPSGIIGFLISFAFIAGLWLLNHRTFRYYFAPTAIDMALVFVELCGVALIPYSLEIFLRFGGHAEGEAFYSIVYAVILGSSAIIGFRGFRRNWQAWPPKSRVQRWRTPLLQTSAAVILASVSLLVVFTNVENLAYLYFLIPVVAIYLRRVYRGVPSYARETPATAAPHSATSAES